MDSSGFFALFSTTVVHTDFIGWQINLRAAHRCGSRCHGENHSYLSSEQGDKGDSGSYMGSGTHSAAVAAAKTPGGTPTQLRDGTALQGFPGSSGDSSSDRRRRGRPQDGGDFSGDHYCRVSLARKGSPDEAEVRSSLRGFILVLRRTHLGGWCDTMEARKEVMENELSVFVKEELVPHGAVRTC